MVVSFVRKNLLFTELHTSTYRAVRTSSICVELY